MGASTGRGGTALAQQQLREALEFPRAVVLDEPQVFVPEAYMHFDERGELADDSIRAEIAELLDTLAHVAGGVTLAA
jgi:NAD(P)H-dependent FMN reductase